MADSNNFNKVSLKAIDDPVVSINLFPNVFIFYILEQSGLILEIEE